jgi:4-amino-4-deoxy-L-arabinose transferase-like glycosyltransferase
LFLPVYLNAHLGLRLLESQSLRWDEAEQTLFTQRFAIGYNDQPPVYTWLLWSVFQVTGVSLIGIYLLKALILAAIYAGVFAVCRRLECDSYTLPATLSLLLTPYFAWSALIDGAHTLFVTAFVPVTFLLVCRLLERPTRIGFTILGLLIGLGCLAKYSFALLAMALLIAIATMPNLRSRLRDPRILLTILVAAIIVLPHTFWVIDHWDLIRERPMHRGGIDPSLSFGSKLWQGLTSLAISTLVVVPVLAAIALFFPSGSRRVLTQPACLDATRLLGRWLAVVSVILLLLVVFGVTRFRSHWLIPAVVLAPAYVFARIAEAPPAAGRIRRFLALIALSVVVVIGVRIAGIAKESRIGGKYWGQDRLHAALASEVSTRNLEGATFVGDHPLACGNLRLLHPAAQVTCVSYTAFEIDGESTRGVIWDATYQPGFSTCLEDWLKSHGLFDRLDWSSVAYVDAPTSDAGRGLRRIGIMLLRNTHAPID